MIWLALHIPILLILRCMQLSQFSVASSKSIRIILHRCYSFCCCRFCFWFCCCSRKCWCDARTWKRMKLILWWVMNITYIYYVFCQALSGAHGSHDDRRITWSSIMVCKYRHLLFCCSSPMSCSVVGCNRNGAITTTIIAVVFVDIVIVAIVMSSSVWLIESMYTA